MRWPNIKRHVSQYCGDAMRSKTISDSRSKRHESEIWQRRFEEHQIRDENDFDRDITPIGIRSNMVRLICTEWRADAPYSSDLKIMSLKKGQA
jgi:hypothetical protein